VLLLVLTRLKYCCVVPIFPLVRPPDQFRNGTSVPDLTLKLCGLTSLCNGAKVEESRINTGPFDTREKCNGVIELGYPVAVRQVTGYGRAVKGNRLGEMRVTFWPLATLFAREGERRWRWPEANKSFGRSHSPGHSHSLRRGRDSDAGNACDLLPDRAASYEGKSGSVEAWSPDIRGRRR
jgi:hypothetical protein